MIGYKEYGLELFGKNGFGIFLMFLNRVLCVGLFS